MKSDNKHRILGDQAKEYLNKLKLEICERKDQ